MTFQMKSNYFDPLTGCCSTQPSCLLYYLIYLEKKTAILCSFSSSQSRTNQQKNAKKNCLHHKVSIYPVILRIQLGSLAPNE